MTLWKGHIRSCIWSNFTLFNNSALISLAVHLILPYQDLLRSFCSLKYLCMILNTFAFCLRWTSYIYSKGSFMYFLRGHHSYFCPLNLILPLSQSSHYFMYFIFYRPISHQVMSPQSCWIIIFICLYRRTKCTKM